MKHKATSPTQRRARRQACTTSRWRNRSCGLRWACVNPGLVFGTLHISGARLLATGRALLDPKLPVLAGDQEGFRQPQKQAALRTEKSLLVANCKQERD